MMSPAECIRELDDLHVRLQMILSPLATHKRAGALPAGQQVAAALHNLIAAAEHGLDTVCCPAWPSPAEAASAAAAKAREERLSRR